MGVNCNMKKLYLWEIKHPEPRIGKYSMMIVCAENREQAISYHVYGKEKEHWDFEKDLDHWIQWEDRFKLKTTCIGIAFKDIKEGIICANYWAWE